MTAKKPVVYLHIGAMKTGTTFLQQLMSANKENLLAAGYLFPGRTWRDQGYAAREVLGMKRTMKDPAMRERVAGKWEALTKEMLTFEGKASIFSMEFLSFADREQARRIVGSLAGAEVHVILGVRDAAGAIPAQWQTQSRNASTLSWPEFAQGATRAGQPGPVPRAGKAARLRWARKPRPRSERDEAAKTFRTTQGIPHMLRVWGELVPPQRLHVITLPSSGSDELLLWRRFAEVVGLDPSVATKPVERANTSMGQASAELIRRVNASLGRIPITQYDSTVKGPLAKKILSSRARTEARPAMDLATLRFAADWNAQVRKAILDSGAQVVGDLDELPTEVPAEVAASAPATLTDPPDDEILAAAATARDGLVELIERRARRIDALGREPSGVDLAELAADTPTEPGRWATATEPVEAAVQEVTSLVRTAIDLQTRIQAAKAFGSD